MNSFYILALSLLFSELCFGRVFKQIQSFNCDFDDNVLFTSAVILPTHSATQQPFPVSTQHWPLVKDALGIEVPWKELVLNDKSFEQFSDRTEAGANLFRSQVMTAVHQKGTNARGPSFYAFQEAMRLPATRNVTTLITARRHSPEAILAGLRYLVEIGWIAATPLLKNIYPVGWPELPAQFKANSVSQSKALVMKYELDRISEIAVPGNATRVTDREGASLAKLHLWGFSDDDYSNFESARDMLSQEVKAGRWPNIKIVLYFTGRNHPSYRPHSIVLRDNGTWRYTFPEEATRMNAPEEIKLLHEADRSFQLLLAACRGKRG